MKFLEEEHARQALEPQKKYMVYKLVKLNKKRKGNRGLSARVKQSLVKQEWNNNSRSMDFMSDSLMGKRKF